MKKREQTLTLCDLLERKISSIVLGQKDCVHARRKAIQHGADLVVDSLINHDTLIMSLGSRCKNPVF